MYDPDPRTSRRVARPRTGAPWLVTAIFYGLLLALAWRVFVPRGFGGLFDPDAAPRAVTARGDLAADEQTTIELFERVSPSVVHISTSQVQAQRGFFGVNQVEVPEGSGSGLVWSDDGHIVTNFHVIQHADKAQVRLSDHSMWDARLVGVAPDYDLAVLKIDAPARCLPPILLGRSEDLRVGQKVFAIGNPFGLDQTLTTGVISGLDRRMRAVSGRDIQGVVQTDAAINPGNSGGPLLDSAGLLIGVNTAIQSPSGASAGIGFAVPVDTVNRIVPKVIAGDRFVERPALGVLVPPDRFARERLGIERGAVLSDLVPGGAAERAGLRAWTEDARGELVPGDVILAIDGVEVVDRDDLFAALEAYQPGDEVAVRVRRGAEGPEKEVRVVLQTLTPRAR